VPYRLVPFANENFYHVFNRGVEKRITFLDNRDYQRLIEIIYYYQYSGPKPRFSTHKRFKVINFDQNPKIVEIICYCLMPNHFHFLLKQVQESGIQEFLSKVTNSYTKYFNTKYKRVGPLFQGQFKAVRVESNEQLLHLSRYILLNPYVGSLHHEWKTYPYSSIFEFVNEAKNNICSTKYITEHFPSGEDYQKFIADQQGYAQELEIIKHTLFDED